MYRREGAAQELFIAIKENPGQFEDYHIKDGLIVYKDRLFVPADPTIKDLILQEYHDTFLGGHAGIQRTTARISAHFYWKGMAADIKGYVQKCTVCQQVKSLTTASPGLLQPLPLPTGVWRDLSMDFITGLPLVQHLSVIMVVVDRLTKYAHFSAMSAGFTASSVAKFFIEGICRLHGVPNTIVFDKDPIFTSLFWKELFVQQGTRVYNSSSYHPQSNGQTEVINRVLEDYLRCFASENLSKWPDLLPWAELHYNTAKQSAINMTPFEAVYGQPPETLKDYVAGQSSVASVDLILSKRSQLLDQLKENLLRARHRMVQQENKKRKDVSFNVDDWVFIKLQPYRQTSSKDQRYSKLSKRYFGPFKIVARIGEVAYKLALPDGAKIHNVFHISMLKKCYDPINQGTVSWPEQFETVFPCDQPEKVLAQRTILQQGRWIHQVLIKWQGLSIDDATWEGRDELLLRYPDFSLEVEDVLKEGEVVTMLEQDTGLELDKPKKTTRAAQAGPEVYEKDTRTVRQRRPTQRFGIEGWNMTGMLCNNEYNKLPRGGL